MNILRRSGFRCFLPQCAALLLLGAAPLLGEPPAAAPAPAQPAKKSIHVGMPAAELQALIGKPGEIIPVPPKAGDNRQAEVWVYRRLVRSYTEVVTIGTKPIMGKKSNGDGTWSDVVLSTEPVTKNRLTQVYEVVRFLIVDGHYAATTKFEEQQQSFQ